MTHKIILTLITITVLACILYLLISSRKFQFFGGLVNRVDTKEKVIALTFDDAPTEYLDTVLKTMKDKKVKGTFYVIGKNAEKFPGSVQKIINDGHEVGNHTYSHAFFTFKSLDFIEKEVDTTTKILRDSGYVGELTFRPPYGHKLIGLPWYLSKTGMKTIMWDVEPDTYLKNTQDKIDYVMKKTNPGSIILMHPFCDRECSSDREMLPIIIDKLQAEGYRFVTVSELLKY